MKMKLQSLVLLVLLCAVAQGKVFERCEWARLLKKHGMDNYKGISLADWVCLTAHVSNYNTKTTNKNFDGSTNYGIFQINSRWWCKDGGRSSTNSCGIRCSALLCNNQKAAINCAKRFVQDTGGVWAWEAWVTHCEGKDLSIYTDGCGL